MSASDRLVIMGYMRRDGSWSSLDPWELDTDRNVNRIRRALTEATAKFDGAVALAEIHVSTVFWKEHNELARRFVDESFVSSFEELIAGGPEWHTEQA